jgi:hypothetical protein
MRAIPWPKAETGADFVFVFLKLTSMRCLIIEYMNAFGAHSPFAPAEAGAQTWRHQRTLALGPRFRGDEREGRIAVLVTRVCHAKGRATPDSSALRAAISKIDSSS